MKKRSERMNKVFLLSEREEQEECRTMGRAQQRLDEDVARLEELKSYRESYSAQRKQPRQCNSMQLKDYQSFLERLDQAVALQSQVVREGQQNRDTHRRRWMAKRRKAESLERVVTRIRDDETADEERSLQNASDDLAQKSSLYPGSAR